ncbi:MAG TPA: sigma-70 family RNA polymerase sigma factor [Thermoleophilaceae bacterium]
MQSSTLSPTQERELIAAAEGGDEEACRELVELFLPAIRGVAARFGTGGQLQWTELVQEGVAGLLFAARRYDPRRGTPFWAYASFWVRKAMQELVADLTRPVALSDHGVRKLASVKAARRNHVQAHGAEPTTAELAGVTGLAQPQVDRLLATDRAPRSFDEPLGVEDGTVGTFGDTVVDPGAESAYDRVLDAMEIEAVRSCAETLDTRERTVLSAHYGLSRTPRTLTEIGADLGLTAERIRQIEKEALEKLREAVLEPPATGA